MESLSNVDLGSKLLSIVIAGGIVAFALLVFRIIIGTSKVIIKDIKFRLKKGSNSNYIKKGFTDTDNNKQN